MVPEAHRPGKPFLEGERPRRLLPKHHSHLSLPHVPTPPPFNISTSTCEMPRGTRPQAGGRLPLLSTTNDGPPGGSEDSTRPPGAAKKGKVSKPAFFYSHSRRGRGRDAEQNFLLPFFFPSAARGDRTPRSCGAEGMGGGEPPRIV